MAFITQHDCDVCHGFDRRLRGNYVSLYQARYRGAQTFKHTNSKVFKHLRVLGQTLFLLKIKLSQ